MGWSITVASTSFQGWFLPVAFKLKAVPTCSVLQLFPATIPCHCARSATRRDQWQRKLPVPWLMKPALCAELSPYHELQNTADFSTWWIPAVAFHCNHPERGYREALEWTQSMAQPICPKTTWLKQNKIKEESHHQKGLVRAEQPTSEYRSCQILTCHIQCISALNIKSVSEFPL